jgi:hypothetical protein
MNLNYGLKRNKKIDQINLHGFYFGPHFLKHGITPYHEFKIIEEFRIHSKYEAQTLKYKSLIQKQKVMIKVTIGSILIVLINSLIW